MLIGLIFIHIGGVITDWMLTGENLVKAMITGQKEFADDENPPYQKSVRVPTLRNVGLSAPYSHNGYFATLKDIVNFKNTRDVVDWEAPEVLDNLNKADIGNLGLADQDLDDIVAFLMTLTDQ